MAKDKSSFIFYTDWVHIFDALSTEDSGKLIKQMLDYVNDRNPEELGGLMNAVYAPIKARLKKDLRKWEETREKRAEAGRQGGLAKASNAKQSVANLPVNVNVNVNEYNNIPNREEFDEFILSVGRNDLDKQGLWDKIESWKENGWKDGYDKPIKNWKSKLRNQFKYNTIKTNTRPLLPL